MSTDPFNKYQDKPSYLLDGESEGASLERIDARIHELSGKSSGRRRLKWMAMAAMILVVLFAGRYGLFGDRSGSELVSSYYEVYPNYQTNITRGIVADAQLADAYQAYDEGAFDLATQAFKAQSILSAVDGLYYAIALQGLSEWETSLQLLYRIRNELPDEYVAAGEWYLVLALVAQERYEEASPILEAIASGKSEFSGKAVDLLNDIQ
ncbi:MAG: hypothetical protein DRI69_02320 [Bacteroidetes bacterium]|nr:MAG: hypothetical protein DRI69_02320 [Bacteroidota bacterium]